MKNKGICRLSTIKTIIIWYQKIILTENYYKKGKNKILKKNYLKKYERK
jgi:hypothetical protein